jgi:hypothetical protein
MLQTRLFCYDCKREWLEPHANYVNSAPCSVSGNPPHMNNCPICGSSDVRIIQYNSEPGLDIPRDSNGNPIPLGFTRPEPIAPQVRIESNFFVLNNLIPFAVAPPRVPYMTEEEYES